MEIMFFFSYYTLASTYTVATVYHEKPGNLSMKLHLALKAQLFWLRLSNDDLYITCDKINIWTRKCNYSLFLTIHFVTSQLKGEQKIKRFHMLISKFPLYQHNIIQQ